MTTTTINVHIHDDLLAKCAVIFAQHTSQNTNTVCVSVESVDFFFRTSGQIRQVIETLAEAEQRMLVLEKEPQ